jgi:uncharacterized membrane protein
MTSDDHGDSQSTLASLARSLGLLGAGGASLGFALAVAVTPGPLTQYFEANQLPSSARQLFLALMLGAAALAVLVGAAYVATNYADTAVVRRLSHATRRSTPLYLVGFVALLFRWEAWRGHDLPFLMLVAVFGLAAWAAVMSAMRAGPFAWEERLGSSLRRLRQAIDDRFPRLLSALPFALVVAGAIGYACYFGYYTYCFYYSLRSGYDLGIYDSLLWNMLHGGSFFKTPPWAGPGRSHFGNHAEFFAYAILPFYALRQNGGTLLVIQAAFLGSAAIPLYKLARKHIDSWPACILALSYLIYPALHGENLFEFHFLPFGPFVLWWAWYFLESRRDGWAALFVLLTLTVREDVSSWVAVLGAYFLLSGRRPKAGLLVAVIGTLWCFTLKFVAMPHIGGGESFTDIYKDLIPPGGKGFGSVVLTVFGNPAFTMSTLAETSKLIYMLQILLPLAFLPFRRSIGLLLCIPGFFFTVLSTQYGPLVSIYFQYSAHWIAFLFPGVALGIERLNARDAAGPGSRPPCRSVERQWAALAALLCLSAPVSYQFGAVFQQHNSWGGPIKYVFGVDAQGRIRHQAAEKLVRLLPPRAKVSASGFTTPYISNRPDAYNMTLGIFDAQYIFFPSEPADFIVDERATVTRLLRNEDFGVVAIEPPFVLAKRNHSKDLNVQLFTRWEGRN